MKVSLYNAISSRQLAVAVVTTAPTRSGPAASSSDARIVDMGGGWQQGTWRSALRRLASRNAVTAVGLRAEPRDRQLTAAEWRRIVRFAADRAGLASRPWVAVRTATATIALFSETTGRAPNLDAVRAFVRTVATRQATRPTGNRVDGLVKLSFATAPDSRSAEHGSAAQAGAPTTISYRRGR